jgi:IS605 OrfB family transposase
MQRTIKINLKEDKDLIKTISIFSKARQYINGVGYNKKINNKYELSKQTYFKVKKLYPNLPTGLIQTARDISFESIKKEKNKKLIKVKEFSSVRLDKRNLRVNIEHGLISISSINGRKKLTFNDNPLTIKYKDWKPIAGTLSYKNKKLTLGIVVEKDKPITNIDNQLNLGGIQSKDILGIDRGIKNIAVCSNNLFYNSKHLRDVKGRYQYLKRILQSKDTPSAKRKLKEISDKERRFVTDTNHCLSKEIVDSDFKVFILEDLKNIRCKNYGRRFNKLLGNWSYYQFENFLSYKAEERNKEVIFVKPNYTSQMCSNCNHTEKSNRPGNEFECKQCGFKLHADLNASRNIANLGITEINRMSVNHPIVTSKQDSYKPTTLVVGN